MAGAAAACASLRREIASDQPAGHGDLPVVLSNIGKTAQQRVGGLSAEERQAPRGSYKEPRSRRTSIFYRLNSACVCK